MEYTAFVDCSGCGKKLPIVGFIFDYGDEVYYCRTCYNDNIPAIHEEQLMEHEDYHMNRIRQYYARKQAK